MKSRTYITAILFLWMPCIVLNSKEIPKKDPEGISGNRVVCVTMPKGGTHLLLKCLALLGVPELTTRYASIDGIKPSQSGWVFYDKVNRYDPPHHFRGRQNPITMGSFPDRLKRSIDSHRSVTDIRWFHWPYTKEAEDYIVTRSRANFFVTRDPRALLVSMAFMVSKGYRGEEADPKPIMLDFIDGRQKNFIRWGVTVNEGYPMLWEHGVVNFYKMYLPWMQAKKFHTVRFEDLVGSRGGGSDERQYHEIQKIAKHVDVELSAEKIKQISDDLFGGSATFREGQIDGWKKHFTPEMKEAFKKVPGANQLLIDLGYETNAAW
jgi:hypothetical protein